MNENVEALPKRLADLGVRYPPEREEEFVAELQAIYARYYGASLNEIDPLQVIREAFALIYSMNLRLPDAIRPARQVDRDRRRGRRRPLPGLQRLRGRQAVRARADARALHAAADARPRAPRGLAAGARWRSSCRTRSTTRSSRCATAEIEVGFVHKGLDDFMHKLDVLAEPARDRPRRDRRPDRVEPDRDLRDERPARARRARRSRCSASLLSGVLGVWLLWGVIRSGRI